MVGKSVANNSQPTAFLWQTTMQYDKLGRKANTSDPDMREWSYIYDDADNLARPAARTTWASST